ncbi:glycosyl hydrolase [Rhodocaloribacter litoris]|uniref:WD40/YVTN/BNR-like repeat-containing protein n=1 Tax=Rhodocaloribacter litoris TaxID=2558931 RepID=UPI0014247E95|nr:glycosyl hydrolase [Rhodocaloribacter litoris]QXD15831.1 glycosyl hydrolase [Rhodocaloribacter litoris]
MIAPRLPLRILPVLFLLFPTAIHAQDDVPVDPKRLEAMEWRNIGPFRGGRVTAVAGVAADPMTYYMGATGGGVWKTTDGGTTWKNVSDGFFKTGSVGAVAVAPSDPNVVYVGMGEAPIRGVMTSHGDGVYRSTDAGRTWTHLGLEKTEHIAKVIVHPGDPDVVYVAAQGNAWRPTPERGIYRSTDGGRTWERVLFVDEGTGASDLSMDATNPRILYAAFWTHRRYPWQVVSGGDGSGLFKSTDGGDTWERLREGLPERMGKTAVTVSPANPDRVWALIEAEDGGLFRSDDAGKTWTRVNKERVLRARAWYYIHVMADPLDEETVYVMNAPLLRSTDGGRTFRPVPTPHGDNHALWINPHDNRILINGNDGGANVSFNGGKTWSTQANQPTAQFYRVITDNRFPYYVYGGQQDNSSVAIASRTMDAGIGREDWYPVGGCESAFPAFDPDNPRYVYAGCYQGLITEYDTETRMTRSVMAYEFLGLGETPSDMKYRFNWNAPIVVSPHDPNVIYHAGNVVLRSDDRGNTWREISPDLTRDEPEKQGPGGAPITNEGAGGEVYNTIAYLAASPHEPGTLWAGTDDGLVHVTRDEGRTWQNVTPEGLGEALVNAIEVSPHDPATAYLAVTRYKFGDYTPHVYKTTDYGRSWRRLVEGLPDGAWVRVVREDPGRRDLLYAGTELGLFISFDGGRRWQPFQNNLPVVPITDLAVHAGDLVAATQGRAFWILDDLTPLHQLTADVLAHDGPFLFRPRPAYLTGGANPEQTDEGRNPPNGALLHYLLPAGADSSLKLELLDGEEVLRTLTPKKTGNAAGLTVKEGLNRVVWDLRRDPVTRVPGLFTFGSLDGYRVPPGTYTARLIAGADTLVQPLAVVPDPRLEATPAQWAERAALLDTLRTTVDAIHRAVLRLRKVREQVKDRMTLTADHPEADTLRATGQRLVDALAAWEEHLVQPRQETFQDVINFPNKLNAHLLNLMSKIDGSPPPVTQGMRARLNDLLARWDEHRATMQRLLDEDVAAFNALFDALGIPAVIVPERAGAPASAPAGPGSPP